ncbi:unnamed protein product [Discosporangium mesarthrocarpum]
MNNAQNLHFALQSVYYAAHFVPPNCLSVCGLCYLCIHLNILVRNDCRLSIVRFCVHIIGFSSLLLLTGQQVLVLEYDDKSLRTPIVLLGIFTAHQPQTVSSPGQGSWLMCTIHVSEAY